jgi:hypothetical protein
VEPSELSIRPFETRMAEALANAGRVFTASPTTIIGPQRRQRRETRTRGAINRKNGEVYDHEGGVLRRDRSQKKDRVFDG